MKARIKFRKYGALRFIGHLDVMRFFQKVMRRADIPIAFTGGYSPHMIMSFASPLGIGLSSDGEYFDIELREAVNSTDAVRRMRQIHDMELPPFSASYHEYYCLSMIFYCLSINLQRGTTRRGNGQKTTPGRSERTAPASV